MRVLTLTTLYPYPGCPRHGVFVENRLRAVAARGHEIRVAAPIPWFPFKAEMFSDWARYADAPARETRHGIEIAHPRYPLLPKVGMSMAVPALERVFTRAIAEEIAAGRRPDLIDAHYLFPDGVAAARAAARFDLPVVLTARGSDVTLLPTFAGPKRMIREAIGRSARTITVARALANGLIALGAPPSRLRTIRNGVDLDLFSMADRPPRAGRTRRLLTVGHLIHRKRHDVAIDVLRHLPDATLTIVGDGEARQGLERQAVRVGVGDRVRFAGEQPHNALAAFYRDADILLLPSEREGWPNVLLEAMACGTPAVAADAGGTREVITAPEAGRVVEGHDPEDFADAVRDLLDTGPAPAATRAYAEGFGWDAVAEQVEEVWTSAAKTASPHGWGRRSPAPPRDHVRMLLTVDTEERFDWTGDHCHWDVPPIGALERLQATAEAAGVVPLYFCTWPILDDPAHAERLAGWHAEGRADVGLHLHAWSVLPVEGAADMSLTYQCNLDPELHRQKLAALAGRFEDVFGARPRAHRAGRYGVAPWVLDQLREIGVTHDFSPSAGFDFRAGHGPDFTGFGNAPRRRDDGMTVYPVTGGFAVRKLGWFVPPHVAPRYLARLPQGFVPVRLSPEGNSAATMKRLARSAGRPGTLLTPSLHLTSVVPGATSYAATDAEVASLLGELTDFLQWAQAEGVTPVRLSELVGD